MISILSGPTPHLVKARHAPPPKFQGTTFGNIIAGGVTGMIVDAATGANYEYPSNVHLSLAPIPVAPLATIQPQPSPQPVMYRPVPVS